MTTAHRGNTTARKRRFASNALLTAVALTFLLCGRTRAAAAGGETPTLISMHLRDVPVKDAYAELSRKADVRFRFTWSPPSDDRRVSLTLVQEPFWTALSQLNAAAERQVATSGRDDDGRPELAMQPSEMLR